MPDDLKHNSASPPEIATMHDALLARLDAVRRSIRAYVAAEGTARLAATLAGLAALTLLLDWWLEMSLPARLIALIVAAGIIAYVVLRYFIRPLSIPLAPIDVAAVIDAAHRGSSQPQIAPRVASVLQLPGFASQPGENSPALIDRAVRQCYAALQRVDFRAGLNRRHLMYCLAALVMAIAVPSAFGMAFPGVARLWAQRWFAGSNQPWPRDTHLEVVGVKDGRLVVPRGEPGTLHVLVTDQAEATETVWARLRTDSGQDDTVTLTRFAPGDFRFELPPMQLTTDVSVWGGDAAAETFQIVPLDRPRIASLELRSKSPRDAQETVHTFTGAEGNSRLLPQTRAALTVETSTPVSKIDVDSAAGVPLEFRQIDDTHFTAEWTHTAPVQARLTLHGRDVEFESHPRGVSIGVMPDRAPQISLRHSGVRLRVTPSATIPLTLTARDDFGLRRVDLHARLIAPKGLGADAASDADVEDEGDQEPAEDPDEQDSLPETGTTEPGPAETSTADEDFPFDDAAPTETNEAGEAEPKEKQAAVENLSPEARTVYGPMETAELTNLDHSTDFDLVPRHLQPGRTLVLSSSATDDCYLGEQTGNSRQVVFRIVRPEELFREILARQQQLRARLRKAADQAETLEDRLPTAQIPDDATELLRTHQLIRRETGRVNRELHESVEEMRLNRLGGEESWQLITANVLNPLDRLYEQEMDQQRLALESQAGPVPDPFEEIIDRQQTIVSAMDRILDNMAQWDSFIDVVNQLNSVINLERSVREKTEELKRTQTESIFE
mgnify:CR=1 FL=1